MTKKTREKTVRVMDLPVPCPPDVVLFCPFCHAEFSATRGDYFMSPPDRVFRCSCDDRAPLRLVRKVHSVQDWTK